MDALREFAREVGPLQIFLGKVNSVNETDYTIDVTLNDSTHLPDARLRAVVNDNMPMVMTPVVGSYVLLGKIGETADWVVLAFDQVDKVIWNANQITINGGDNAGLVKVKELTTKLNNLENKVNAMIEIFNTHVHGGVTTGAGTSAVTPTIITPELTVTQQSEIEDVKIKH